MMTHRSSSQRLFELPELLAFVCRFSCIDQRARLLCVSRSLFNIAAPLVWEKVAGADRLLSLLPGVTVTAKETDTSSFRNIRIIVRSFLVPFPPSFNLYSSRMPTGFQAMPVLGGSTTMRRSLNILKSILQMGVITKLLAGVDY